MEQNVGVAWRHLMQDSSLLRQNLHRSRGDHLRIEQYYRPNFDTVAI